MGTPFAVDGNRIRELAWLALLLVAVALVHAAALGGEFVYDDILLVAQNPALRSLDRLPDAFSAGYWAFLDADSAARIGYWRPLTTLALFAGQQVGGGSPWGFHLVSLVLHLAATAGLFALVRRLTTGTRTAFAAALIFGLHPVTVEAVAWISAVNDPLQGTFVFFGLAGFLRWRERGSAGWPLAAMVCLALALLAKESGAALVPMALALDLGRRERGGTRPFRRAYAPLLLVGLGYWAARAYVFGDWMGGFDRVTSHLYLDLARSLSIRAELFGGALALLAWPDHLNLFREVRPVVPLSDPQLASAFLWIGVWAAGVVVAVVRKAPRALAALLILPAGILPALIRFESIGRFPLSERFLYLSAAGVALLAALALARLPRLPAALALGVLAIPLGVRSHARIDSWKDELTVFRRAVAASPESLYVHWGLGRVLLGEFRRTGDLATLEEAHQEFLTAQDLGSPADGSRVPTSRLVTPHDLLQANLGVGWYYFLCAVHTPERCSMPEAELVFGETAKRTADTPFQSARAYALTGLGVALLYQDRFDEAEAALLEAVEIYPSLREAWYDLGQLERRRENWSGAAEHFRRALDIAPTDLETLVGLAEALVQMDRGADARPVLSRALALAPDDPSVLLQLGILHGREDNHAKALEYLDRALQRDGRLGNAHLLRAKALIRLDDPQGAVFAFQEACRYLPDSFDAHYNLGALLLGFGLNEDAKPYLERALEIDPNGPNAALIRDALEKMREE